MTNKEKFAQWLNEKWVDGIACPVCKQNNWGLYDQLWELREFHEGGMVIGGPIIPLAVMTCNNCGHTLHFNAIKVGLTDKEEGKDTKDEKQEPSNIK